jgi:TATA-box binding protein (TBP) (component of TFIID and TFIIIB)
MSLQVNNFVGQSSFFSRLNLKDICLATNGKFGKETFPAAVISIKTPDTTSTVFESGENLNTGGKNMYDSLLSMYLIQLCIVRDLGRNVRLKNFDVSNIATSADLGYEVDLVEFHRLHQADTFIHARFKGMTWKTHTELNEPVTLSIFGSGKLLAVGLESIEQIPRVEKLFDIIKTFKKDGGIKRIENVKKRKRLLTEPIVYTNKIR